MDTSPWKTPDPLAFAAWQAMPPAAAASEVHRRVAALPPPLRQAALAWLLPEPELAAALEIKEPSTMFARNEKRIGVNPLHQPPQHTAINAPHSRTPTDALHPPPLHGVPCFVKDLYDVAGVPTRAGSTFLDAVRPTAGDSRLVRRMRELGTGIAGKTHMVEFASGLTGENPHYGDCPHPGFPDRLSGGSSSGSAALVAAGVVPLALGTDTGGSVRVPAAFCGLYGFRLTPRDEFIRDAFPLSPTMDTAGWFTGNPGDLLTTWRAMTGAPPHTSSREPHGCYLPGHTLLPEMDAAVDATCSRAAAGLARRADDATEMALLSEWKGAVDAYLVIGMSEAHAVHRDWLAPYRGHYDPAIWQRFDDAGRLPAETIAAARTKFATVRKVWDQFFQTHDFLVLPCAPFPALRKSECTPAARRGILTLTAPASLGGLACLTLPVSLGGGLTAGLQVILSRPDSPAVEWILGKCG
ncbi:MAG: amidase [Opitutales bacterium]